MSDRRKPYLVVAGNIGSGKTTVCTRLAGELGLTPVLAPAAENPYLERFYADPPASQRRWAFHSQLFFFEVGLRQHAQMQAANFGCVQELSVYEHFLVVAHDQRDQGWISQEDFNLLSGLFYSVEPMLTPPDLLVLLQTPVDQLAARSAGRPGIDAAYLARLEARYAGFADTWLRSPVLSIDTAEVDLDDPAGLDLAAELVIARLGSVA